MQASYGAFATILESGYVVTWGDPNCGGDSSQAQEQLRNVQDIQATQSAFATILESGAVVTWGRASYGGDSSQVQEQLRNVQRIQATDNGVFAAILNSGYVVTCVSRNVAETAVQEQLSNFQRIETTVVFCCYA